MRAPGEKISYRESRSKYRAVRTEYNGEKYDSKFEAGQAALLDIRLRAGEIKGWERQFKVECVPFTSDGRPVKGLTVRHRVGFRGRASEGGRGALGQHNQGQGGAHEFQ